MILGKCIYNILSNDSDVSGVISTKIYPSLAVEDVAYPYISYNQEGHEFSDAKDGKSQLDIISYDIEIYSETLSELNDLGIKVRNALDRYSGTVEGIEIQSVRYTNESYVYNDIDRVFNKTQTYSFRYLTIYNTLSKPTNLNVAVGSSTQLDLTWTDNSTGESGFEIWRSTNLTSWTLINTTAANATSYSDTVTTETQYYYKVTPTDGTNRGESSNIAGGYAAVAGASASGITYDRPQQSGSVISYATYDDAWHLADGAYDYTPPVYPVSYAQLDNDHATPFLNLLNNNSFGNKSRFTYSDGTQTYSTDYVVDNLTGLGWSKNKQPFDTWGNTLTTVAASTLAGYSDWRLPTLAELDSIFNFELTVGSNYAPFSESGGHLFSSTQTNSLTTTDVICRYNYAGQYTRTRSKTGNSHYYYMVRNHFN